MDNTILQTLNEIVKCCKQLSEHSGKLATLLENHIPVIDPSWYPDWPRLPIDIKSAADIRLEIDHNFDNLRILEVTINGTLVLSEAYNSDVDLLLLGQYPWNNKKQPSHITIIDNPSYGPTYDLIIFNESLEMLVTPLENIKDLKRCLKPNGCIFARIKPWTSQDGAKLTRSQPTLAYAHLAVPTDSRVKWRFTSPEEYSNIFHNAGMRMISRTKSHVQVNNFFHKPEILQHIVPRTWGTFNTESALRIMGIDTITCLASLGTE